MNTDQNNFFGEPISCYSRAQAIQDGVLVDLSGQFPVVREHFKIPMACTSAVWNEVAEAVTRYGKDYAGVLHDLCWLARLQIGKGTGGSTLRFRCIVGVKERSYKLICGPGDDPRPVLTLLKENED